MLIHNKDDIEFVTEFPCLLGNPVVQNCIFDQFDFITLCKVFTLTEEINQTFFSKIALINRFKKSFFFL